MPRAVSVSGSTTHATSVAITAPDAHPLAGDARVLGRDEVRVGAERPLRREVEHLRPERGGDPAVGRHGFEPVEERAHRGERARVVAVRLGVADADAEQEPPGEVGVELGVSVSGGRGSCCQTLRIPVAIVIALVASRNGRASSVDGLPPIHNVE